MSDIKVALKKIVGNNRSDMYSVVAKVIEVDEGKRVCSVEPINGDAIIYDVRLQAAQDQVDGLVLIPAVDSAVVVTFLAPNDGYVAQRTVVEKVLLVIEGQTLEYTKDGLSLMSDQAKFAEQVDLLITTMGKVMDTLLQFQLSTNVGPTISVMPQVVTLINQHKADFQQVGDKLKTMLY